MTLATIVMTTLSLAVNAKEQPSGASTERTFLLKTSTTDYLQEKTGPIAAKTKPAQAAQRAYSKREYLRLRQRYKANQPQAHRALSGSRLALDATVVNDNMAIHRDLWPVARDVIYGNIPALEKRLGDGLNPDTTVFLAYPYNQNDSLLDLAIQAGQRNIIKVLLNHGASVNPIVTSPDEVAGPDGETIFEAPLPLAASYGEDDVVRLLLKHGADINQRLGLPHNNETALTAAVYTEEPSTAYLLLTHGASIKLAFSPDGRIPEILLQGPILSSRMIVLRKLLIRYGAKMPSRH